MATRLIGINTGRVQPKPSSIINIPPVAGQVGKGSGILEGNYGVQHYFHLPVTNPRASTQKILIFADNRGAGGDCKNDVAIYAYGGTGICEHAACVAGEYIDIIEESIPGNSTTTLNFQIVVPAVSCAPYAIGVRKA